MTEACRGKVHSIAATPVYVRGREPCPRCSEPMNVQKTVTHGGRTLAHGSFEAHETVLECRVGCRDEAGRRITRRQPQLAELLVPRSVVGYDVMAHVGIARFLHFRPREGIRTELAQRYGLSLSTGEISALAKRCLVYLEALHFHRAPVLRETLQHDGGWPLHVDATGEAGRGTLLVAYAGWRSWVLGAWKIPSEHAGAIVPKLHLLHSHFGTPCGIMRDLGRAVIRACRSFVEELGQPIPIFGCHFHLVRDVGKDLLREAHDRLRTLLRSHEIRAHLRALARDLGRSLGADIDPARREVEAWMAGPDGTHPVPSGRPAIALTRALAQWVLDYPADGRDEGFPFDVPYLDLYERCQKSRRALEAFLRTPPGDAKARRCVERLHRIVAATREPTFQAPTRTLQERRQLLDELRTALRVEGKPQRPPPLLQASSPQAIAEDREVSVALAKLASSLRERLLDRGPSEETRQAIGIILAHLDRHGASLSGHAIPLPPQLGGGVRLVQRTKVRLENFFGAVKHGERKRCGRKDLAADLEHLPGAAPLVSNLRHRDYLEILCGASLDHLPKAFSELDAGNRTKSLPARTPARSDGAEANVTRVSMPKADRILIRSPALREMIHAAAHSPAPLGAPPEPIGLHGPANGLGLHP